VKNPALTSAAVLIGLALAVGAFAWMSSGQNDPGPAAVLTRPENETVAFIPLSPREQRKKNNLEQTKRELHKIRETGEEVSPGVFKITDNTGDATYYYGDLIPGKGRDGEPMYLSVQFKRLPAPPLKTHKKVGKAKMDTKRHDGVLKFGDGAVSGAKSAGTDSGNAGAGAASSGDSGAPGGGGSGNSSFDKPSPPK